LKNVALLAVLATFRFLIRPVRVVFRQECSEGFKGVYEHGEVGRD